MSWLTAPAPARALPAQATAGWPAAARAAGPRSIPPPSSPLYRPEIGSGTLATVPRLPLSARPDQPTNTDRKADRHRHHLDVCWLDPQLLPAAGLQQLDFEPAAVGREAQHACALAVVLRRPDQPLEHHHRRLLPIPPLGDPGPPRSGVQANLVLRSRGPGQFGAGVPGVPAVSVFSSAQVAFLVYCSACHE